MVNIVNTGKYEYETANFRAKFVREAFKTLETGLTCVGATGIEDRLQVNAAIT